MAGDPGFLHALDELRALHLSKGHDYADETDPLKNYVQSSRDGGVEPWRGAFIRLSEKYHRIINLLAKDAAPNHESLDDTFMDLAAMALIVRSLRARPVPDSGIANTSEQVYTFPHTPSSGAGVPTSGTSCGCSVYHAAICSPQGDGDDGA